MILLSATVAFLSAKMVLEVGINCSFSFHFSFFLLNDESNHECIIPPFLFVVNFGSSFSSSLLSFLSSLFTFTYQWQAAISHLFVINHKNLLLYPIPSFSPFLFLQLPCFPPFFAPQIFSFLPLLFLIYSPLPSFPLFFFRLLPSFLPLAPNFPPTLPYSFCWL